MKGKHIVLGITGGIAAYKCATLARLFVKAGAEVQVIMTPNAKEFITPLTMSTLTGKPVISEFFTANTGEWHSHVDLGLWADAMVIAPATASTMAKMAHGVADNMLVTSYLSCRAPVFVAPAMDLDMMAHPTTQANIRTLQEHGCHIIEAAEGELASHLVGKGRMAEPEEIATVIADWFAKDQVAQGSNPCTTPCTDDLAGRHVLITAGPTYERIDPVRFIGNYSSGKMGYALAAEAARRGARVTLVSGPVNITINHPGINIVRVESARQMLDACLAAFDSADIAVMCAAVADYAPRSVADSKIKRENQDIPVIELVKNPDIAATLGQRKRPGQVLVGFALETDHEMTNAVDKVRRKHLDMIALNSLRDAGAGFGVDTNRVTLIYADGRSVPYDLKSKAAVAADIIDAAVTLLKTKKT